MTVVKYGIAFLVGGLALVALTLNVDAVGKVASYLKFTK